MIFVLLVLSAALAHTQVAALSTSVRTIGQVSRQRITQYQRSIAAQWQSPQGRRRIMKYTGVATVTAVGVIAYLLRSSKAGGKKASTTSSSSASPVPPINKVLPDTLPAKTSAKKDTTSTPRVTPTVTSPGSPAPKSAPTAPLSPLPPSAASLVSQPNGGNNNITNTPPATEPTPAATQNASPVGESPVVVSGGDPSSGQPTPDLEGSAVLV